jgi:hypothetical protein
VDCLSAAAVEPVDGDLGRSSRLWFRNGICPSTNHTLAADLTMQMRPVSIALLAVVAACDGGSVTRIGGLTKSSAAASIVISGSSSVAVGQTTQLSAAVTTDTGTVAAGRTFIWASANSLVATVNNSGVVTGIAAGETAITATADGATGSRTITVTAAAPAR